MEIFFGGAECFAFSSSRKRYSGKTESADAFPVPCVKPTTGKKMIQVREQSRVLAKRKRRPSKNREPYPRKEYGEGELFREDNPESRFLIEEGFVGLVTLHIGGKFQKAVGHIHDATPTGSDVFIDLR